MMKEKTRKKWINIIEQYDPQEHGSLRHYCQKMGINYGTLRVYQSRLKGEAVLSRKAMESKVIREKIEGVPCFFYRLEAEQA